MAKYIVGNQVYEDTTAGKFVVGGRVFEGASADAVAPNLSLPTAAG